jgi:LPXTG-motif cell wall-anchored protein
MFSLLAQAAADQYGDKTQNHLPDTGFPLPLAVAVGVLLVIIAIVLLRAAR